MHPLVWIVLGVARWPWPGWRGWGSLDGHGEFSGRCRCLLAALLRRYGGGAIRRRGKPPLLGRGPYVTADGTATFDLVARLTGVVQQLRAASAAEIWSADWTEFDRRLAQSADWPSTPTI